MVLCFLAVSSREEYREYIRGVLRAEAFQVVLGLLIALVGVAALSVFVVRKRFKDRAVIWFGVFALLYGTRLLLDTATVPFVLYLPESAVRWWINILTYIMPIPGTFFGYEIVPGWRPVLRWGLGFLIAFASTAIVVDLATGRPGSLHSANNVVAVTNWLVVGIALFRYGKPLPFIRALQWGIGALGITVVLGNLRGLGMPGLPFDPEPLGFAYFLGSLGRVLALRTFENQDRLRTLEKELEIATRIQQSILPREMPASGYLKIAAHYLPMTSVAGDFYDFLRLDDRRIGILIADATGHGVPAALIASMVKIAIAAQLPYADDPARVLAGMNQTLCGKMQGQFVSAAYLFIDLEAGMFRYAAGGHPPLLRLSAKTKEVETIQENGLLLGIMPQALYTSCERLLSPGDRFLLYTDGLLEAANTADEFFGGARVHQMLEETKHLGVEDSAISLLDGLRRFAGYDRGRMQEDDLTVIVLEIM